MTLTDTQSKLVAATALFGLWTALVWYGHADPGIIEAIKYALGGLGFYHAISNLQAAQAPASGISAEQVAALLAAKSQQFPSLSSTVLTNGESK